MHAHDGTSLGGVARQNEARLQWFLSQDGVTTVGVEGPVSHRYAEIHRTLRARGTPIPTNHLWIPAIAIELGLVISTRDAHFAAVPGWHASDPLEFPPFLEVTDLRPARRTRAKAICHRTDFSGGFPIAGETPPW
jgi:hypothetical protein